jgi:DNA-binding transcriptional ArsR family regulator
MVVDQISDADVDRIFHALADGTRRDILALAVGGGYNVSALAKRYPMSFAAVQKHVAVLESAALVRKERLGREQIVHANPARLHAAAELLDAFEQLWVHRANQIADILTRTEGEPT